jgi:ornithine cyclodeaminase/alanine dehydrogenase-like protein (mu-crystallin family)
VRPITSVVVRGRAPDRASALANSLHDELGVAATAGSDVSGADIVCLCTTATTPVVSAADLAPTACVTAIGAHVPDAREVAADVVASSFVVVDDASAARKEAGDLIMAIAEGAVSEEVFDVDLAALARGSVAVPPGRTLFKSVGFGLADLLVARLLA